MRKPLQAIADIRAGYTFRGKIEEDSQGDVYVLQIKDIKGCGGKFPADLPRIHWVGAGQPPVLAAGDIVMPARGEYYEAVVADGTLPVVPTSQLFVLHVRNEAVIPEYLCWFLNQSVTRSYFEANRMGTNMPMLTKQVLGELVVVVPLEKQHRIVALQRLWEQEKRVTEELLRNQETMLKGIFKKLLEH
jgi:hypothetical protein